MPPDYYQCFQCKQKFKSAIYCPRCGVMTVEKYLKPNEQLVNVPSPNQVQLQPAPRPAPAPTRHDIHIHQDTKAVEMLASEVVDEIRWRRFWRNLVFWVIAICLGLCLYLSYIAISAFMEGFTGKSSSSEKVEVQPTSTRPAVLESDSDWYLISIHLYKLYGHLPSGWKLREFNYRPNPEFQYEHCADYEITDKSQKAKLLMLPNCGMGEWLPEPCPTGYEFSTQDPAVVRYYDKSKKTYFYTEDVRGALDGGGMACFMPPILTFGTSNSFIAIEFRFTYSGTQSDAQKVLPVIDKIISYLYVQ